MKKFKATKRFSLEFLGKDWKEAYIDFDRVSIADAKNILPKFRTVDSANDKEVDKGIAEMIDFLKGKFVAGKGLVKEGLVDLEVDDLEGLPLEVLSRALGFLSQGVTPDSPKP